MKVSSLLLRMVTRLGIPPQKVLLVASDLLALAGTFCLVLLLRLPFDGFSRGESYVDPLLLLLAGPVLAAFLGLYPLITLPAHLEIRRLATVATLLYALILGMIFMRQSSIELSRFIIGGAWFLTLFTLPVMRGLCRRRFSRRSWWGSPLVILDHGRTASHLWHDLKRHPERGLNPVDIFDLPDDRMKLEAQLSGLARRWPGAVAMVVQHAGEGAGLDFVSEVNRHFSRVLLVPAFGRGFRVHWMSPCDLGNIVGLQLRQNLHDAWRICLKRAIDLFFCIAFMPLLLLIGAALGLLIVCDSPGPVLYRQWRVGRNGRRIGVYKFRTMVRNADAVLKEMLEMDPELAAEWERDQKLRCDPRVTRVGAFLRKTSLDELPQLINVVTGDMSLVGPRPVVEGERGKYGPVFDEYCRVRPGITGLWQVSGRNNTSYAERVAYDHYYINNWSVWMDIWILCRTVPVVLTGYGAY
ncbi:MAG: undecaprenyl-phosphate galactose phosphotransferase WbaP [Desulfovibrio sp.]|nr:undecaprenyl-phosphate galactose phosphotransferase WbaP [Desulfovibrio sp.]